MCNITCAFKLLRVVVNWLPRAAWNPFGTEQINTPLLKLSRLCN